MSTLLRVTRSALPFGRRGRALSGPPSRPVNLAPLRIGSITRYAVEGLGRRTRLGAGDIVWSALSRAQASSVSRVSSKALLGSDSDMRHPDASHQPQSAPDRVCRRASDVHNRSLVCSRRIALRCVGERCNAFRRSADSDGPRTGEVEVMDEVMPGIDVHIASRVRAASTPGRHTGFTQSSLARSGEGFGERSLGSMEGFDEAAALEAPVRGVPVRWDGRELRHNGDTRSALVH